MLIAVCVSVLHMLILLVCVCTQLISAVAWFYTICMTTEKWQTAELTRLLIFGLTEGSSRCHTSHQRTWISKPRSSPRYSGKKFRIGQNSSWSLVLNCHALSKTTVIVSEQPSPSYIDCQFSCRFGRRMRLQQMLQDVSAFIRSEPGWLA